MVSCFIVHEQIYVEGAGEFRYPFAVFAEEEDAKQAVAGAYQAHGLVSEYVAAFERDWSLTVQYTGMSSGGRHQSVGNAREEFLNKLGVPKELHYPRVGTEYGYERVDYYKG